MIVRLAIALFFAGLVGGCSTPKVIEATRLSDRDLSCESLKEEYRYAEQAKKDAEDVIRGLSLEVDKGEQKSNWLKRPLTEAQKLYAANDVLLKLSRSEGLGLPGFGLPWQERRIEAPELRLVLLPAQAAAPAPAPAARSAPTRSRPRSAGRSWR
mgnify:CR=1 FL=1